MGSSKTFWWALRSYIDLSWGANVLKFKIRGSSAKRLNLKALNNKDSDIPASKRGIYIYALSFFFDWTSLYNFSRFSLLTLLNLLIGDQTIPPWTGHSWSCWVYLYSYFVQISSIFSLLRLQNLRITVLINHHISLTSNVRLRSYPKP